MYRNAARKRQPTTCLIVEDSAFDQERMRRILMRSFQDMSVIVVATLEDARTIVETSPVSLILLDNDMPDGQGANFAVELSTMPHLAHIPVIMVSDWPSPFMFHKAEMAGVLHVVNKADFGARYIHSALAAVAKHPGPRRAS